MEPRRGHQEAVTITQRPGHRYESCRGHQEAVTITQRPGRRYESCRGTNLRRRFRRLAGLLDSWTAGSPTRQNGTVQVKAVVRREPHGNTEHGQPGRRGLRCPVWKSFTTSSSRSRSGSAAIACLRTLREELDQLDYRIHVEVSADERHYELNLPSDRSIRLSLLRTSTLRSPATSPAPSVSVKRTTRRTCHGEGR